MKLRLKCIKKEKEQKKKKNKKKNKMNYTSIPLRTLFSIISEYFKHNIYVCDKL